MRRVRAATGTAAVAVLLGAVPAAQDQGLVGEIRQIVSFHLSPGSLVQVEQIYRQQLLPIYEGITPLLRLRAYHEAESPEPVDLVIVSAYRDMAGMDQANDMLRRPARGGLSPLRFYDQISRHTVAHTDQFVEMRPRLSDPVSDQEPPPEITVFEYVQLVPAAHDAYEELLAGRVRDFEKDEALYAWSETGRLIVADGWDYLRTYGLRSLADWQEYQGRIRAAEFGPDLAGITMRKKTLVLRRAPEMSVR
ncbi:MAG: hypothetical protein AB7O67_05835 [Vicinamibacterales bacterium]